MSAVVSPILRRILILDAVTCLGAALLFIVAAGWVRHALGITAGVQSVALVILIAFAGILVTVAVRQAANRAALRFIVLGNAAWVALSVGYLLLASGLTTLGQTFVLVQAAVVAVLAWMEHRHGPRTAAGTGATELA